ncbi:TatD family hydrolase [Metabacillus litoralis]|uniref:TatD family hydrolase n=1 Tax=Metabacillus litoralis TaxID=152268 RepID=UPI001CFEB787|nr:TatD family hydrolase [Metabacillus litoralis]
MMIDAHIHLDQYPDELLEKYIHDWQENGIESVVAVATNLSSSYHTLKLKQKYPTFIRAAIGHHPEFPPPSSTELQELLHLIKREKDLLSGIGEIGLPTYNKNVLYKHDHEEVFEELLEQFLQVAKAENLPIAIHAVHEESEKALASLKKHEIKRAHFHWLKSSKKAVSEIVKCGYYISVTPEVCYRERDQQLAKIVPVHQLLIETDAPWQFNEKFKERETTPLFLKEIVISLSNILSIPEKELTKNVTTNTKNLYSL